VQRIAATLGQHGDFVMAVAKYRPVSSDSDR
jgi:hypothetical protein